jgi:hypothetical protein
MGRGSEGIRSGRVYRSWMLFRVVADILCLTCRWWKAWKSQRNNQSLACLAP